MKKLTILLDEKDEDNIDFVLNYLATAIRKGNTKNDKFPVKWQIENQQKDESHSIFVMFEFDYKDNKANCTLLGAFDSKDALESAKNNTNSHNNCKIEIVETELNNLKKP
jgi:hypothetical protein